jgi:hypothetical protein
MCHKGWRELRLAQREESLKLQRYLPTMQRDLIKPIPGGALTQNPQGICHVE